MEIWLTYFFLMILLAINITGFFVCVRCLIDVEEIRIIRKVADHFDKSKVTYTDGDNT